MYSVCQFEAMRWRTMLPLGGIEQMAEPLLDTSLHMARCGSDDEL